MQKNKSSIWMFLIGLGSVTQVWFMGSVGLSEVPIFLLAPFVFIKNYHLLKRDGFLPFIWLSILTSFCCGLSGLINHTPYVFFIKGFASPYAVFAVAVVFHHFLRKNFNSLKWFLVGAFLSSIISIFIFQQATYTVRGGEMLVGDDAMGAVVSNPLFWSSRISAVLLLPISGWFLSVPFAYSALIPFIAGSIKILFSDSSGRAAALVSFLGGFCILITGKRISGMKRLGRNIGVIIFFLLCALFVGKNVYSYVAANGYLGYKAQEKYFRQTQGETSLLKIIMGGRLDFFTAIRACIDRPIIGFGPKPIDEKGYYEEMLSKYGNPDDYEMYRKAIVNQAKQGSMIRFIPSHSHIASFWLQYGIVGLIFWVYVLGMMFKYFKKYAFAIPHWYGFCALSITALVWDVFFSPFSNRIQVPLVMCCILFARAVALGRIKLPYEMKRHISTVN